VSSLQAITNGATGPAVATQITSSAAQLVNACR
jgi:hypothetical protein